MALRWSGVTATARAAVPIVLLVAWPARAQTADPASAEALFRDGKRLLEQQSYAASCAKLAESLRLDPATGTLLALAMCHQGQGRIATAWAEYTDAAARAKTEGRADREEGARARAAELEPSLSTLEIAPSSEVEQLSELSVARDGIVLNRAAFHTPIPVDPGEHTIAAKAPGRRSWAITIVVGTSAEKRTVDIPPLERSTYSAGPVRIAGIVVGSAGALGLAVGAGLALYVIDRNAASNAPGGCVGDVCRGDAKQARLDARSAGDAATVALIAGGALLAAGAGMFFFGQSREATTASLRVAPALGLDRASVVLDGRF